MGRHKKKTNSINGSLEKKPNEITETTNSPEEYPDSDEYADLITESKENEQPEKKKKRKKKEIPFEGLQIGTLALIPINAICENLVKTTSEEAFRLTPEQQAELTKAFDGVGDKYLPEWLEKYSAEFTLLIVSGMIFLPRYLLYTEWKKSHLTSVKKETMKDNFIEKEVD